ncbi:MAG TPA: hypothetical protein VGE52_11245 [Pirellulales bacterium]
MYDDSIQQAERLATLGSGKPKQSDLPLAVSAAYYAVFYLLIDEACCVVVGATRAARPYRHALGRAFTHTTMKLACTSFRGGNLKATVVKGLPRNPAGQYAIANEIREIAGVFVELQEARYLASYDLSEQFARSAVVALIDRARRAADAFRALPESADRKFFLACLWSWKELVNR